MPQWSVMNASRADKQQNQQDNTDTFVLMLLLQVAQAVYDLIGGEVDHASTDEEDLSDDIKVVRRLAALNLLAAKGWTPTVSFWEVRDLVTCQPLLLHPCRMAACQVW
jgi:hypothetical protein